jgi:hypothetical protein
VARGVYFGGLISTSQIIAILIALSALIVMAVASKKNSPGMKDSG